MLPEQFASRHWHHHRRRRRRNIGPAGTSADIASSPQHRNSMIGFAYVWRRTVCGCVRTAEPHNNKSAKLSTCICVCQSRHLRWLSSSLTSDPQSSQDNGWNVLCVVITVVQKLDGCRIELNNTQARRACYRAAMRAPKSWQCTTLGCVWNNQFLRLVVGRAPIFSPAAQITPHTRHIRCADGEIGAKFVTHIHQFEYRK